MEKPASKGLEKDAPKKISGQSSTQDRNDHTRQGTEIDEITGRYLDGLECSQHFPVLEDGGGRREYPEDNEGKANPEGKTPLHRITVLRHQHMDKQAESLNDKTKCHEGKRGSSPSQ